MHTQLLNLSAAEINPHQRYMSLSQGGVSLHWNDIMTLLGDLDPNLPLYEVYQGDDLATPTQFDVTHMNALQVPLRSTRETLQDSILYLTEIGALD
jgi:hypothetical protein